MWDIINRLSTDPTIPNNSSTGINGISDFLVIVLNVLVGLGFMFGLISIGFAGITYITSSGEPKAAKKAWDSFLWGVIATLISVGILGVKRALIGLYGVQQTNITNDTPGI